MELWNQFACFRTFEFAVARVVAALVLLCDLEYLEFEGELCEVVVCFIFMMAVSSFSVAERGLPLELATRLTPLFLWQRSGANFTSLMCLMDKLNLYFLSLSSSQPSCLPVRRTGSIIPRSWRGSCFGEFS